MKKQVRVKSKSTVRIRDQSPVRQPHIETIRVGHPQVYTVQIYPPITSNFNMSITPFHPKPPYIICPSCGYENGIDFLFCNKCGTELEEIPSDRS